jgi:predicted AAA+ superfamily ATPase
VLQRNVDAELETLQALATLTPDALRDGLPFAGYWPEFEVEPVDIAAEYRHRVSNIGRYGYGVYARFRMFCIDEEGHIAPVHSPDPVRLSELVDYERERRIILDNTRALLAGKPAANILLSGDAGTGKSSTVKAIVNELYREGLRILEVRKEQLRAIPHILAELSDNPLKFILFIDDLSFRSDDDNYSALKAILEGSVSSKASNTVIYATSNRRHLVREKFSDREGDDVHLNDTLQEMLSLSERFGLQVTFKRPDKKTYLDIVRHLVQERGIDMDAAELELAAERFALARGGRSARAARQFADSLVTEVTI